MKRLLFLGVLACGAFALEYYPVQVVFVRSGVPTPVILAVGTPAELETLIFTIVEQPKFGVLLGFPPELIYIPREGFTGSDWFSFLIQASDGQLLDYGTVQLRVIGPVEMISPSLRLEGTLTFSGPSFLVESYRFDFGVYGRFQYLEAQAHATWDQTGFSSFRTVSRIELEGDWPGPWRLPIVSTMTFSPATLSLSSWTVQASTTISGWDLSWFFYYSGADPQTGSYTTFTVRGQIDSYHISSRTKFATLTPTFAEQALTLRGPWPCGDCPVHWELEFMQTKLGFDHLRFLIKDVPIPCPQCEPFRIYLDAKITFAVAEKKVEPALRLWPIPLCARPLVELITPADGFGFSGLNLYGVEIRCDLPDGYKARFATSFDPAKDSAVTGYAQFFEVIQFEGPVIPCCGSPGWWQISAYFERGTPKLFGFGMFDTNIYFPLFRELIVNVRLKAGNVDPNDPTKTWILTLGWKGLF